MFSSLDLQHYLDALVFGLRRPPGWCESFDGCMSKLPEASVGAATGSCGLPVAPVGAATGSCGLPDAMVGDAAVSPRLTRSAGVAGSAEDCEGLSRGTVSPIRLICCLLLFEFLQVLRSGRPVRDSLPGGIVWPCGRGRRDSPPRALYVATRDGLAAEW